MIMFYKRFIKQDQKKIGCFAHSVAYSKESFLEFSLPLHLPDILGYARDLVAAQIQILELSQLGDLFGEVRQLISAQIELLQRGAAHTGASASASASAHMLGQQRFGQRRIGQQIVLNDQCDQRQLTDGIRQQRDRIGAEIEYLQIAELLQHAGQADQAIVIEQHRLDVAARLQQRLVRRSQMILQCDQIQIHATKVAGLQLSRIRVRAVRRIELHGVYGALHLSLVY